MEIRMTGLDYSKAAVEIREKLTFSESKIEGVLTGLYDAGGFSENNIGGMLILSTCNRTELWISCKEEDEIDLTAILKSLTSIEEKDFLNIENLLTERRGDEALGHLLSTACGLNSMVFGEEQIITQIREALKIARKAGTASSTIEKAFQTAIAAAKDVKTKMFIGDYRPSVASRGIAKICDRGKELQGRHCLVIGNGKMGELIADNLVAKGAVVEMTKRRRYHHGDDFESLMPKGCKMIDYETRYEALSRADIVVSATMSPHHTLKLSKLSEYDVRQPSVWLDLAVPRDIEPEISKFYDIKIYDIDSLYDNADTATNVEKKKLEVLTLLGSYKEEINTWLEFRKHMSKILNITDLTKTDAYERVKKEIIKMGFSEEENKKLEKIISGGCGRAVNKLVCGLKNTLPAEEWEECFEALLESAKMETIKK